MLRELCWISMFYFTFACGPCEEGFKWLPENSIILRSLGWTQPRFFEFSKPYTNDYIKFDDFFSNDAYVEFLNHPMWFDDDIWAFDDHVGLESFDLIGGDIIPCKNDSKDGKTKAIKDKLWPKGVVPYVITVNSSRKINAIKKGMKYIESVSCIRFVPRTEEKHYIRIINGTGCSSMIGMMGGVQDVTLAPICYSLGVIMHELLHALGFNHEQSRSDRDKYINIFWDNIEKGHERNFEKDKPDEELLLTPYDYDSIMQYGETSFSKNKTIGLKTMTAKKKGVVLKNPSQKVLSRSDIKRIHLLYNCWKIK